MVDRLSTRAVALLLTTALVAQSHAQQGQQAQRTALATPAIDTALLETLEWRNIGPFRGGRVTAVAGIASQPFTYFMGATGGGVWKTDDGGTTWRNITDKFVRSGSVGAIGIADGDPNVIYVGMGEAPIRGVASAQGDGVYKSTDGGRTWKHVGLDATRQISRVLVHPTNADVAYVAAQGSRWGPTDERGIYRTTDGGRSWSRVLFVNQTAGASDLAIDASNPRVLYAAFWDHQRFPWRVRSGGPGSGIHKSTDGGDSWTKLTEGLPKGVMGKIGVAVSPANPDRVWALIEADDGGLYRSDDAGKTWRRVNEDRLLRARAWYYTHVTADPANADVVYVLNAPFLKSTDGGRTFQTIATPHGDNHALWVNPRNTAHMINGNDGGANVSFNGGRTWSTQANQPTAQFYRVNTDARFPYWVYGGQQDNSTVAIASRSFGPGIDRTDWFPVAGCESGYVAFDPSNPTRTYAGCYQGIIEEYDSELRRTRNIMAWPALGLGEPSSEQKYRFNWNAPIVTSPHDRSILYHGGNVLFRSSDRGQSWSVMSPDLTRNEKTKQGPGGEPITNEGAGGEVYNTILSVVESPHERGVIWVGTDDGLIQLTRDGGRTWVNVTPRGPGEALVNAIEASPHDPAAAYIAITRYKFNDNTPHIFRTTDYGRSWTRLVDGIRPSDIVRVVREDPVRRGLLYAGSESGAYVSFDGGQRWQSLQRNLPVVPVTDLQVRDNDLVASTEGRSFWILDDLTLLHQLHATGGRAPWVTSPAHLLVPRAAYKVDGGTAELPGLGRNPPNGAVIRYHLASAHDSTSEVRLEVLDASGGLVRAFTSRRQPAPQAPGATEPRPLAAKKGMNAVTWDLRRENVLRVPGIFLAGNPQGYRVPAGQYQLRLSAAGSTVTQPLEVRNDPRLKVADADVRKHDDLLKRIHARVNEIHQSVIDARSVREQVNALLARTKDESGAKPLADAGKGILARVDSLEGQLVQPRHKTFQDVINFRNGLSDQYLFLADAVDGTDPPITAGMQQRFEALEADWNVYREALARLLSGDVAAFNALVKERGIPAVIVPPKPNTVSMSQRR